MDLLKDLQVGRLSLMAMALGMFLCVSESALAEAKASGKGTGEPAHEVSEDMRSWMGRQPASASAVSGSAQARKRYPGGADEDDLQVQATLPSPNRGLEAHQEAVAAPTEAPAAAD